MTPRRALPALLALIAASFITLLPGSVGAAQGDLQLVAQNFNIAADGVLTASIALPTSLAAADLSTATIAVSVYERVVGNGEGLRAIVSGTLPPPIGTVTMSPAVWTAPVAVSVPLEAAPAAAVAATPALTITRPGLYPVTIAVQRDGATLSKVVTFINRLPAAGDATDSTDTMSVALAIGTHSSIHLDDKATTSLDPSAEKAVAEMTALAKALEALAPSKMPATVSVSPAVLTAIRELRPDLFARLIASLQLHQVIAEPQWPLDPSAAAAAKQDSLYTSWLRNGEDSLAALIQTPISDSTMFVDQPISAEGATLRRNLGAHMMVMTPHIYDALDGSIKVFSDYTGSLIAANLPNGVAFDAAVVDHWISDLLVHPLPTIEQTRIYAVAHLLALRQGIQAADDIVRRHAVVIATPDVGVPDDSLIGSIASLITQTPGLTAATLDDVSLHTDRLVLKGEDQPVTLPTVDGKALITRIFTQGVLNGEIDGVASMLPPDDERPSAWRDLSGLLPTTALDDASATSLVTGVRTQLDQITGAVHVPAPYTINLTGRQSTVRVPFVNDSDVALFIKVELTSPSGKLDFANDPQPVRLAPGVTTYVPITVNARSNGTSGVTLDVSTPNDSQLAPPVPLKVRVNALGVGNVLTAALFGLVLLWWLQHLRSTRRKRRQPPRATVPAS